jgi:hypothetical protein
MKILFILAMSLAVKWAGAQGAERFSILITEIMADPSPVVGLPNAEYIEVRNCSGTAINLSGWKIGDAVSVANISANFLLHPDSVVILCSNANIAAFSFFGKAIGVSSFPSLDNEGDQLTLRSPGNKVIHSIAYTAAWYGSAAKAEGGWSLEMIDTGNPCNGSNWKGSNDPRGGTPGKPNSVKAANPDTSSPSLLRSYSTDSITIMLVFDEPLDSLSGAAAGNYQLAGIGITSANTVSPLFNTVQLKLAAPLQKEQVYEVIASTVKDCSGNSISMTGKVPAGLSQLAQASDIIINEILFDPRSGGYDFIELYNRSKKTIDLHGLTVCNRDNNGALASVKKISEQPFQIYPGMHVVISNDRVNLGLQYLVKNKMNVFEVDLPSYPDDKGIAVLADLNANIIDELHYDKKWQFPLIADPEGVSLERINSDDSTQRQGNWHSAASTAGWATPGYKNSQQKDAMEPGNTVSVDLAIFSPNNDGFDDLAIIRYQVHDRGWVANITCFNLQCRPVRLLVRNEVLGLKGSWTWDGLDDKGRPLPSGNYILLAECFNLQGKRQRFKIAIALAGPMK